MRVACPVIILKRLRVFPPLNFWVEYVRISLGEYVAAAVRTAQTAPRPATAPAAPAGYLITLIQRCTVMQSKSRPNTLTVQNLKMLLCVVRNSQASALAVEQGAWSWSNSVVYRP